MFTYVSFSQQNVIIATVRIFFKSPFLGHWKTVLIFWLGERLCSWFALLCVIRVKNLSFSTWGLDRIAGSFPVLQKPKAVSCLVAWQTAMAMWNGRTDAGPAGQERSTFVLQLGPSSVTITKAGDCTSTDSQRRAAQKSLLDQCTILGHTDSRRK